MMNMSSILLRQRGGNVRVKTLRDPKGIVQESSKKVVFSSRIVVAMWYNLKFLELSVFVEFLPLNLPATVSRPCNPPLMC